MVGIMTLAYLRWCLEKGLLTKKLWKWSVNCMGVNGDIEFPKRTIEKGISALENWLRSIGLAVRLSELGIDAEELYPCAELSAPAGNISKLDPGVIMEIYRLAK